MTCDRIDEPIWEEVDSHGRATERIAMCELGKYYLLPLRLDADDPVPATDDRG